MNEGIGQWIVKRSLLSGDRPALISVDRTLTFAELDHRTDQVAAGLLNLGVRRGDRVAVLLLNSIEFIEVLMGCSKIGAITVPVNIRLTGQEVGFILADSGADVLVYHDQFAPTARGALDITGVHIRNVFRVAGHPLSGENDYEDLLADDATARVHGDVGRGDPAFLMYTSGTTGRPKGAILTHDNLLWNAINILGTDQGLRGSDRTVAVAPMFHIGGLGVHTLPLLYVGGTSIIHATFDASATLRAMADHQVTVQFLVPAMWSALTQVPNFDDHDLSSLQFAMGGGSPVPLTVIDFMQKRGIPFTEGFGMTETAPLVSVLDAANIVERAGSIGRSAMHVDTLIVDDDDREVPRGTVGELIVRGPNVFAGYWMRPEATHAAFRGGWFHTGDLGRMDVDDYITLVDRKKDMIISGGENVYPIEVEQVAGRLPGVREVAIFGVPHDRWGETVVAAVAWEEGASSDGDALIAWCRDRLAHFKCPTRVEVVDELPRNATGKILKMVLRETYSGQGSSVTR